MNSVMDHITTALSVPEKSERTAEEMRAKIFALENHILKCPQTEFDIKHHFAPGLYLREGIIPKGTILTGAIHKTEHLNVISSGEITVWTEDGMKRIKGPAVLPSMPGIKRVGYAHEDTVWINVFHNPTNERDPDKIIGMIATNDYQEFLEFMSKQALIEDKQEAQK